MKDPTSTTWIDNQWQWWTEDCIYSPDKSKRDIITENAWRKADGDVVVKITQRIVRRAKKPKGRGDAVSEKRVVGWAIEFPEDGEWYRYRRESWRCKHVGNAYLFPSEAEANASVERNWRQYGARVVFVDRLVRRAKTEETAKACSMCERRRADLVTSMGEVDSLRHELESSILETESARADVERLTRERDEARKERDYWRKFAAQPLDIARADARRKAIEEAIAKVRCNHVKCGRPDDRYSCPKQMMVLELRGLLDKPAEQAAKAEGKP